MRSIMIILVVEKYSVEWNVRLLLLEASVASQKLEFRNWIYLEQNQNQGPKNVNFLLFFIQMERYCL